eukprot:12629364-Alexandrium_andersonii.AAC.1
MYLGQGRTPWRRAGAAPSGAAHGEPLAVCNGSAAAVHDRCFRAVAMLPLPFCLRRGASATNRQRAYR